MNDYDASKELIDSLTAQYKARWPDSADELKLLLVVATGGYSITRKTGELVVYEGNENNDLLKRFLLAKNVAGCSQRTLRMYKQSLLKCLTDIRKPLKELTSQDIELWIAAMLMRGVSRITADNYRRALSSMLRWMQNNDYILKNPMQRVEKVKAEKRQKKAFTDIECARLREYTSTRRETAIVELLFSTGCRVSELVSIKRYDINGGAIQIIGKGNKQRTVYVTAQAQLAIEKYLEERKDKNPYMFPACSQCWNAVSLQKSKGRWYIDPENVAADGHQDSSVIESYCRKLGKLAGVDDCHPHRFRRTCATMALRNGMPIELVSMMLGHSSIQTTQIYLDIGEAELREAHKKYVR